MANANLSAAKRAKNDEFYTQLTDIEKELRHYRRHFKGKTVLCNCDDPFESNFFKYFALNFNRLGLKKLICTSFGGSPVANSQYDFLSRMPAGSNIHGHAAIVTEVNDANGDGFTDMEDVKALFDLGVNELYELREDGDFRSSECVELLKEADIVCTNPPFSLFREYVAQLMEYGKKFVIIGNINVVTYREFFPLIKENKVWPGYSFNKTMMFAMPESYKSKIDERDDLGRKLGKVPAIAWYTNLDIKKRHEELILVEEYDPDKYPKYDNYDAIEVSRTNLIPCDYAGVMGVPVTFLDKYCSEQFEIVWQAAGNSYANAPHEIMSALHFDPTIRYGGGLGAGVVNGKAKYARILIRNKDVSLEDGVRTWFAYWISRGERLSMLAVSRLCSQYESFCGHDVDLDEFRQVLCDLRREIPGLRVFETDAAGECVSLIDVSSNTTVI